VRRRFRDAGQGGAPSAPAVIADQPAREADQNRREGRQPRSLRDLPDGRGRGVGVNVRRHPDPDRAAAVPIRASMRSAAVRCEVDERRGVPWRSQNRAVSASALSGWRFDRLSGNAEPYFALLKTPEIPNIASQSLVIRGMFAHTSSAGGIVMSIAGACSTRRAFLATGGLFAAGMTMLPLARAFGDLADFNIEDVTIAALQSAMQAGRLTAEALLDLYLERIQALDWNGPTLRAVQEINPDAHASAQALDAERRNKGPRGPLHGIPVLLKDNIATADKLETTAGALALVGARPRQDATIASKLRDAGMVILGKASMSEWAYFKSTPASSGWSARNGQARNPYALDRTPCGSSSGSAIAVAGPAGVNGVVGIKPTVGLTSRAGVIPISATQDTVGSFGRTVADAATLLGALVGVDPRDPATEASAGKSHTDYTAFLDPDGARGARIGVPRDGYFGYSTRRMLSPTRRSSSCAHWALSSSIR
jgi:hypothetical protein